MLKAWTWVEAWLMEVPAASFQHDVHGTGMQCRTQVARVGGTVEHPGSTVSSVARPSLQLWMLDIHWQCASLQHLSFISHTISWPVLLVDHYSQRYTECPLLQQLAGLSALVPLTLSLTSSDPLAMDGYCCGEEAWPGCLYDVPTDTQSLISKTDR